VDVEFHYWITGIVARRAGFAEDEAQIVAYSSQYTDDNDISYAVVDEAGNQPYVNFVTQTMNILKPKAELMRIYPIFHFVPGDPLSWSAKRRDGKMHILNTTPDNALANELLAEAFRAPEDNCLYRIGIATHACADTWAHQNFVGWNDSFNRLGAPKPNIGHTDAWYKPDRVGQEWRDSRLVRPEIVNRTRFLLAARCLFGHYCAYLDGLGQQYPQRPSWDDLEAELADAMSAGPDGGRRERVPTYKHMAPWLPEYDEHWWFGQAIRTEVRGMRDLHDTLGSLLDHFMDKWPWLRARLGDRYFWRPHAPKTSTHWYQFQRAAKAHERFGLKRLSPLFEQMGVDIGRA